MMILLFTTLLVFGTCAWLASDRSLLTMKDRPNQRSLHAVATPHTGGVAIIMGIGIAWTWWADQSGWPDALIWLPVSALLIAIISFLDDLRGIPAISRLAVQGLAALLLVYGGLSLPGMGGAIVSWFVLVWMMNLYNFMDGLDGLAGGMAVFGFGFLGLAAWLAGNPEYAQLVWIIAAAALGFLAINLPPARLFMGDAGAVTLGLLAAVFSLWGVSDRFFPIWFPVLVFSPFIVDATVTLISRLLRGERILQAHRQHYYQQLALLGLGSRKTLLAEYALMLAAGVSALALLQMEEAWQWAGVGLWGVIYPVLMWRAQSYKRQARFAQGLLNK